MRHWTYAAVGVDCCHDARGEFWRARRLGCEELGAAEVGDLGVEGEGDEVEWRRRCVLFGDFVLVVSDTLGQGSPLCV